MKLHVFRRRCLRIAALGLATASVAVPAGAASIAEPTAQGEATVQSISTVGELSRPAPGTTVVQLQRPDEGERGVPPVTASPVTAHPDEGTRGVQPVAETPNQWIGARPGGLPVTGDSATESDWRIVAGGIGGFVVLVLGAFAVGATRRREPLANA